MKCHDESHLEDSAVELGVQCLPTASQGGVRSRSVVNIETVEPAVKGPAAHAQQFGGFHLVTTYLLQRTFDLLPLRGRQEVVVGSCRIVFGGHRHRLIKTLPLTA